jgi:hypothetical protein
MQVVIEFYRIRDIDDAHALVGRHTADAANLDDAIQLARRLRRTLDMPQRPDAMSISDGERNTLYSGAFDADEIRAERMRDGHPESADRRTRAGDTTDIPLVNSFEQDPGGGRGK